MGVRKQLFKNRVQFADHLAKREGGKSQGKRGDLQQFAKLMVRVEADLYKKGHKSAVLMIRREAVALAKKEQARRK
jgi:hypothetical protein